KPLALSMREAEQMVEAADKNNVKLMAGHTMAYSLPVRAMRRIIASGVLGQLRALHVWSYSDWMLRPRSGEELDPAQGGGVPYRQTPHQVDTIRVLGGGKVRSVRGMTGQWMPERPIPGYYTAYLEFENGTPCTILHNGYGYFVATELVPWGGGSVQIYNMEERVKIRQAMQQGRRDEESDKQALRIGGSGETRAFRAEGPKPWRPEDLGMVIASCDRGDIRHSQYGLYVYDDTGQHDVDLGGRRENAVAQRRAELEEFYNAVVLGHPLFHDGRWGMGTLEVGLAIMESARERKEIMLSHQVAVPPEYDAGLQVGYIDERLAAKR
ncbi:MAG: Gfo/Idh/MocA family oxidoreductase, partial [Chloroflexota bacterium]